jgi:hypothetical protein
MDSDPADPQRRVEAGDPAVDSASSEVVIPPDAATHRGLDQPRWNPEQAHDETAAALAKALLWVVGANLILIIVSVDAIALFHDKSLKDLVAFFGTIVTALAALLGGATGYYFGRRRGR